MTASARTMIAPAYLFACLILGGSAQGVWLNMLLQLAGLAIILWAVLDRDSEPMAPAARQLLLLALAAIALVVVQLVPLPASVWTRIGPRDVIAEGFAALGLGRPAQPLSLNPAGSLDSLLGLIPPLAMICAMVKLRAYRPQLLAIALVAGTAVGIALGALQVAGGSEELNGWYLYRETNGGRAVGFFANANHMAILLLASVPFLAALAAAARTGSVQRYSAVVAVLAGLGIVVMVGIALNGSLAGYGLALPVAAVSLLILLPPASRLRLGIALLAGLMVLGALVALYRAPIGPAGFSGQAHSSVQSRAEILSVTMRAAGDFVPFGSGLGSFRQAYHLYEDPATVTTTYVVHAHNDYAELLLELGLGGAILILAFLAWWGLAVWRVWSSGELKPFARAASVASAAILVQSLVDFPLRTAAIAALFAMCVALLADGRAAPPKEKASLRRKRHVEFK